MGREWLNLIRVRVRRQRVVITSLCSFLSFCLLFFSSLMFLLKNDGCCVCFFGFAFISFSLIPFTGHY